MNLESDHPGEPPIVTPLAYITSAKTALCNPQSLPADILVIIVGHLGTDPVEHVYAPLICSHVCTHWRRNIIDSPLLWSYIDVSRGAALTRLWLGRSKTVPLDVRLWDSPKIYYNCRDLSPRELMEHPTNSQNIHEAIQQIKDQWHRWKSLDIALRSVKGIAEILEFLGETARALHLDSLTIGPTGSQLVLSNGRMFDLRFLFETLDVKCKELRVNMFPVYPTPRLFSPSLTHLRVSIEEFDGYGPDMEDWAQILSQTPNLVILELVAFKVTLTSLETPHHSIELPALEYLKLANGFISLTDIIANASLPSLTFLSLSYDSCDGAIARRVMGIGLVAPSIRHLCVSSEYSESWSSTIQYLRSLKELTLFSMGWAQASMIMRSFSGCDVPALIRLDSIYDLRKNESILLDPSTFSLPPITLKNCLYAGRAECFCTEAIVCESEEDSNYSDNDSFIRPPKSSFESPTYPSSEETGSEESSRSYDDDEGGREPSVAVPVRYNINRI
ncbi:F-box-like protein [Ceratobasidium sp. AG-Ba]|nr:F-box-like protein [Ceratobasidium sp. AG-Ba]